MGIGLHNEKTFVWNDTKISTVYSLSSKVYTSASMHRHSHYELFLYESGNGTVSVGNKREHKLSRGNAVIIPPDTDHYIVHSDGTDSMSIAFKFSKISENKQHGAAKVFQYFDKYLSDIEDVIILKDKFFADFVMRFRSESEADSVLAQVLIENLLEDLFLKILRLINKHATKMDDVPIYSYKSTAITSETILSKNIEDYMNQPGCTLTLLAEKLNMCPRNTQKVLKKIYGKSFSELSAQLRLNRAVYLIQNTDMSLAEIAKYSHYNQYASFRKAFILHFGVSPQEYRHAFAETDISED